MTIAVQKKSTRRRVSAIRWRLRRLRRLRMEKRSRKDR